MSYRERMVRNALLARDHPATTSRVKALSPQVLYLTSSIEGEEKVDYFDACVAAEAQALDGRVVSTDPVFDRISGSEGSGECLGASSPQAYLVHH